MSSSAATANNSQLPRRTCYNNKEKNETQLRPEDVRSPYCFEITQPKVDINSPTVLLSHD